MPRQFVGVRYVIILRVSTRAAREHRPYDMRHCKIFMRNLEIKLCRGGVPPAARDTKHMQTPFCRMTVKHDTDGTFYAMPHIQPMPRQFVGMRHEIVFACIHAGGAGAPPLRYTSL